MAGHGGSSAGSYLADPTSPIPSHCASIVVTSTLRVKLIQFPFKLSYSAASHGLTLDWHAFTLAFTAHKYVMQQQHWCDDIEEANDKSHIKGGVALLHGVDLLGQLLNGRW